MKNSIFNHYNSAELFAKMQQYTEPMLVGILTDNMDPLEKIALAKLIIVELDVMIDLLCKKVTSPKGKELLKLIQEV